MSYTLLSPHLKPIADAANRTIKKRYALTSNGKIENSIDSKIPFRPTLHWKTSTHFVACEVADRPFPKSIKESFADILVAGEPIRLIVAYPKDNGLNAKDYQDDIKQCKKFGIGYMSIDDLGNGDIEHQGISLAQYFPFPKDFSIFKNQIKKGVQDAYEHYLHKGDPKVGLQNLGQIIERLLLTTAEQAKTKGSFKCTKFNPPKFISQTQLIKEMIKENILDIIILERCKESAKHRNGVSHIPKDLKEARKIEEKMKENFLEASKILVLLPSLITKKGYKIKV
jgi:hypothetical protein